MDIRGAALDRIQQDLVDESNDRSVLDIVTGNVVLFLVARADIEVLEIEILIIEG